MPFEKFKEKMQEKTLPGLYTELKKRQRTMIEWKKEYDKHPFKKYKEEIIVISAMIKKIERE